jgi:hypothetical protein
VIKISWTDKTALETINQLKKEFNIQTFIETGTFKGINAFVQSSNFKWVVTCEKNPGYYLEAKEKLKDKKNVIVVRMNSPDFLKDYLSRREEKSKEIVFIYLDAHFYDKKRKNKFVVTDELKALKNDFKNSGNCIIAIHDFDNGMGHITYDGKTINMNLVKDLLLKINPEFQFYTNKSDTTEIHTLETLHEIGLENDPEARDNIMYAWSAERLTKRGILYAIPRKINHKKFNLIKWN